MAGEKSGDSKVYQLITLLITSIVAPVTVYFATTTINKMNTPPPTAAPTVVQAQGVTATEAPLGATLTNTPQVTWTDTPAPALTETAAATDTSVPAVPTVTDTAVPPTPTVIGVVNPSGIIPSGSPAVVNHLALTVEQQDIAREGRYIFLTLHLRNLSGEKQAFVFRANAITLKDNTGKRLEPFYGDKKPDCKENDLGEEKKFEIDSNKDVTVHSVNTMKDVSKWCGKDSVNLLPIYAGPVAEDAKSIIVELNGFGPFSGFAIEVPLK